MIRRTGTISLVVSLGVHGVLLCQAETPGAVRAFVESCRYPHHPESVDPTLPTPVARMRGEAPCRQSLPPCGLAARPGHP